MYHEIHHLSRLGFSNRKIAEHLGLDARTVGKYLKMDEQGFEQHLARLSQRKKTLSAYESFVVEKLSLYPDTSTAQMHDWLKEAHPDFPKTTPRTVYNFVMYLRQGHNIPCGHACREYFPVGELPYGEQAQVDFGEYNLRRPSGKRKKVHFFVMVLSRSRMKHLWFQAQPFTAATVVGAHEKAFDFYGGIPKAIVYDQDRTMVVDENLGDIILTGTFKRYTKSRGFNLHFCRKADPQSKGKVENVVQYVKKNFLYNRVYYDLGTLNAEAMAWLSRTANHLPHNRTKKSPEKEFVIEKAQLAPYTPINIPGNDPDMYVVRKDNTVNYKSNFYTLPQGTYKASGANVLLEEKDGRLNIYGLNHELIAAHNVCALQGELVSNTNHRRDTSVKLGQLMQQVAGNFSDNKSAMEYFLQLKKKYPRYVRDHLQAISQSLSGASIETVDKTLDFCMKNNVVNGNEWERVLNVLVEGGADGPFGSNIKLLDESITEKAGQAPQTSNIDDYEDIINL